MSNQDDRKQSREQRLRIGKHDNGLVLVSCRASQPIQLAVGCRPQVELAWYNGVIPDENLLHSFEIVGHVDGFDTRNRIEADDSRV